MIKTLNWWILDKFGNPMTCGDNPSPRDYKISSAPKVVLHDTVDLRVRAEELGFEMTKQSFNSCTSYSRKHGAEIENTIEHGKRIVIDGELQWKFQELNGAKRSQGDFIQNAENVFQKNNQGFPQTEYRKWEGDLEGLLRWIALGKTFRTGISWKYLPNYGTNFKKMLETGVFEAGQGKKLGGHAGIITGFDRTKEVLFFDESELELWGKGKFPKGRLVIPFKCFGEIYSQYFSFDEWDKKPVVEFVEQYKIK